MNDEISSFMTLLRNIDRPPYIVCIVLIILNLESRKFLFGSIYCDIS